MEPVSLTCPKCGAAWKLIKAGKGPITCPQCKAALDGTPTEGPPEAKLPEPAVPPRAIPVVPAEASSEPVPLPSLSPVALQPVEDADDPALQADYDDRPEPQRRRGMAPLLKVAIILLALMILLPVAAMVLFLVACAVMFAAG